MLYKSYLTLFSCLLYSLSILSSTALATQQADFSWLPNQESDLSGYKIYYSTESGQYDQIIDVGNPGVVDGVVQATVPDLANETTYYFVATAYDADGFESDYSQEVVWTSPVEAPVTPPPPPVEEPVPPVANAMSVYLNEDNTVTGMLDGQSQDSLALSYQLVTTGSIGSVSIIDNTVGSFTYTPVANISGMDTFTYKVSDANGESNVAAVTVTINAVNDKPVAAALSFATSEDMVLTGTFSGSDIENDQLTYSIVSDPSLGSATLINEATGTFTYTPNANINGTDIFTYKVSDANGESNVAAVTVTINAVNDKPGSAALSFAVSEDMVLTGTLSGSDIENDQLIYSIVSDPSLGSVILIDETTGIFTYTPGSDLNGPDSFSYVVYDGLEHSNVATVEIVIDPVNDIPEAFDGTLDVEENVMASGILQGSDIDSSQLSFSIVSSGLLGSAAIVDPDAGTYTYTPNEGAYGDDTFQFIMSDGSGESNVASVIVHIERAEAPFAMEIGEINVDGRWVFVSFTEDFRDPVVVAKPASSNDPTPCVVRIRNVSSTGFELRLQNYDYIAAEHRLEQIGYIAIEKGSFILENGKRVEAGMFNTDLTDYPETIAFAAQFPVMPVVAASIVTENEYDAVVSRVDSVTENGFDYQMQEQEVNSPLHTFEDVAYIAWEPFSGMMGDYSFEIGVYGFEIDDQWQQVGFLQGFDRAPVFIADTQTMNGQDTANLRYAELSPTGVEIKVSEEQSFDSEADHDFEIFGFMAISVVDLEGDVDEVEEDKCTEPDRLVITPDITIRYSEDTDRVLFFDASHSFCYEIVNCVERELDCSYTWDFDGPGTVVGGNGKDIVAYMYDNVGQYEASVSLTETVSGNVATGDIVVVAESVQPELLPLDFSATVEEYTAVLSANVSEDIVQMTVFWGDRSRSEYSSPFNESIEHTYNRSRQYRLRIQALDNEGNIFNYTVRNNSYLIVEIP